MSTLLIHAGRALTPTTEINDAGILIREDVIEAIGPRAAMSLPAGAQEVRAIDQTAVPGFIDVHIHGAGGHDVMEGTGAALRSITRKVSEYGTTSLVATTVTASTDETLRAAEGIAAYIGRQHETDEPRAEILGIHFEGPFISKERRGVHPPEWIQLPSVETLGRSPAATVSWVASAAARAASRFLSEGGSPSKDCSWSRRSRHWPRWSDPHASAAPRDRRSGHARAVARRSTGR